MLLLILLWLFENEDESRQRWKCWEIIAIFLTHFGIDFSLSMKSLQNYLFTYFFFFVKSGIYPTKIYYRPTASAKRNEKKKRKKKTWAQSQRRAYRLLVIPSRISFSSFHLSILLFDLHRISPPVILLLLFWFWYIFHYETPTYAWKISKKLVDVKALSFLVFFFFLFNFFSYFSLKAKQTIFFFLLFLYTHCNTTNTTTKTNTNIETQLNSTLIIYPTTIILKSWWFWNTVTRQQTNQQNRTSDLPSTQPLQGSVEPQPKLAHLVDCAWSLLVGCRWSGALPCHLGAPRIQPRGSWFVFVAGEESLSVVQASSQALDT